jgi:transcriptional regulator with XRE-family HTH domain
MKALTSSTPKIGENIKRLRQEKGLSQDKLSKLADISLNTVVKIELGVNPNPTLETIQKLAQSLGVSIDKLVRN